MGMLRWAGETEILEGGTGTMSRPRKLEHTRDFIEDASYALVRRGREDAEGGGGVGEEKHRVAAGDEEGEVGEDGALVWRGCE